jgi:hypothetical protein
LLGIPQSWAGPLFSVKDILTQSHNNSNRLAIEEGATFVGKSEVMPNKNIVKEPNIPHKEEPQKIGAPR